jgi:preprotein translocase subunit SecG
MNKQRKFVLIAAAIGIVSMFLPWISVSLFGYSQSQNGMHRIGVLVFFCFVVSLAFSYLGDQNKNLDKNAW